MMAANQALWPMAVSSDSLVLVLILAAGAAVATLGVMIGMFVTKRWKIGIVMAGLTFTAIIFVAVSGVTLLVRGVTHAVQSVVTTIEQMEVATSMPTSQAVRQGSTYPPRVRRLQGYMDPTELGLTRDEFWSNPGEWDLFRVPMRYPYQLSAIDTLDSALLQKYDGSGSAVELDNADTVDDLHTVTHAACDGDWILGRRKRTDVTGGRRREVTEWFLLECDTDKVRTFASEAELLEAAKRDGYTGPTKLKSIQQLYDESF